MRLLRIERSSTGTGGPTPGPTDRTLSEVTPEEVFRMKYARQHGGDLPEDLLVAFSEILAEVEAER